MSQSNEGSFGELPPTYDEATRQENLRTPGYEAPRDPETNQSSLKPELSVGPLSASIAAISSRDYVVDVFAVGLDRVVLEAQIMGNWSSDYVHPSVGALDGLQIPRSASLSAVSHQRGQVYLFVVDGKGTVQGNLRCSEAQDEGRSSSGKGKGKKGRANENPPRNAWMGWHRLGEIGAISPGAHVVAVSKAPGHIDLFASNAQGDIVTLSYGPSAVDNTQTGASWTQAWRLLCPTEGFEFRVVPGSPICAISPLENRIDLYFVNMEGAVQTIILEQDTKTPPTQSSIPVSIRAIPGSHIAAAVKRHIRGGHVLHLFLVDANGTVQSSANHLSSSGIASLSWSPNLDLYPAKAARRHLFLPGSQLAAFALEAGYISVMGITAEGLIVKGETRTSSDALYGWELMNVDKMFKSEGAVSFAGGPLLAAVAGPENVVALAVGKEGAIIYAKYADWCDSPRWLGWWKVQVPGGALTVLSSEEAGEAAGKLNETEGREVDGRSKRKEIGKDKKGFLMSYLEKRFGI